MAVDDGQHVGPGAIDLAVDSSLEVDAPAARVDRIALQVEFSLYRMAMRDAAGLTIIALVPV